MTSISQAGQTTATYDIQAPPVGTSPALSGKVMGGTNPISGSTVTLYQAGNTTGGSAVSLGTATSDTHGNFSINYTDPDGSPVLYLMAKGGDAGKGPNPAIQLALMLGPAGSLPSPSVVINEVTTVALGYAMRFFIGPLNIHPIAGTSPSLQHAASTSLALVSPLNGTVRPALDSISQGVINGIADILASCVEGSAAECNTLFAQTRPSGGTAPIDTVSALLQMANNPVNNVVSLWGLIGGAPPYLPTPAPASLSVTRTFRSGNSDFLLTGIALDSAGNVWTGNSFNAPHSVIKISKDAVSDCSSGCTAITGGGINDPYALAVDASDDVWVANAGAVTEIAPGAAADCSTGCTLFSNSAGSPGGIAVDASGDIWVSDFTFSRVMRILHGATSCASNNCIIFSGGGIDRPRDITADPFGNIWIANTGSGSTNGGSVTKISSGAAVNCSSGCTNFSAATTSEPVGIAADAAGNIWTGTGISITKIPSGAASCPSDCAYFVDSICCSPFNAPAGLAADAAGNIWIANSGGNSVTKIPAGASSCDTGCLTIMVCILGDPCANEYGAISHPTAIAVDAAGNIWVVNTLTASSRVTEIVGMAVPTKTPSIPPPSSP